MNQYRLTSPDKGRKAKEPMIMIEDNRLEASGRADQVRDPHRSLHSETGAQPGEHPGRSGNPLVKAAGLAWLEFEKPDLDAAERFAIDFGSSTTGATRTG